MRAGDVRVIGLFLILFGFIGIVHTTGIGDAVVTGYQMAMGYPLSVKIPEQKISSTLRGEIAKVSPQERIPVVVVLTAPKNLAIAQQRDVLPSLQMVGFQMTLSTIYVANTMAGTIPAGKIKEIAANANVDEILYDGKYFTLPETYIDVNLLHESVPQIGADKVWAQGYTGEGVTVIVIDTGIQNNHPNLIRDGSSLVLKEHVIVPEAGDYTHWHGTHVAGIVASQDNTYKGVAPGIKGFVDIIAFDSKGSAYLSWVLAALDKAYKEVIAIEGPVVSTNSWGGPNYDTPEMNEVRKAALKLAEEIPVIFSASNSGPSSGTITSPGDADKGDNEIITVGAVDKSNNIASFSSRGPDKWGNEHKEPDVTAPGVDIISTVPEGTKSASGTSMAVPHVAGTIALMLSKNSQLTNKQCLDILMQSALDRGASGFDYAYGAGVVQADNAIALIPRGLPTIPGWVWQASAVVLMFMGFLLVVDPEVVVRGVK